jgi:hypothetical protein
LIQQHGPWLSPEAFDRPAPTPPGAPPAPPALPPALPLPLSPNASLPADAPGDAAEIDRDAISLASLLALAAAAASLATVLMVCVCSAPVTKVKRLFRRRKRDALKHVGQLARYSEGAQGDDQGARALQLQLELKTEIGLLQGLPPLSEALRGGEHPAMRQLEDRTFVHLNEVHFESGARRWRCWAKFTFASGLPWRYWASASHTAAHIFGLRSYRPSDHPLYRDACQVITISPYSSQHLRYLPIALPRRAPGHQRRDARPRGLRLLWRPGRRHAWRRGAHARARRARLEDLGSGVLHQPGGRLAPVGGRVRAGDPPIPGGGGRGRGAPLVITRRAAGHYPRRGEGLQAVSLL